MKNVSNEQILQAISELSEGLLDTQADVKMLKSAE